MKIPKRIQIAGKTIDIVIDPKYCNEEKIYGREVYDRNKIYLDDPVVSGISKEKQEQTFIHEILHYIYDVLGKNDSELNSEAVICPVSELLYQVFKQIQ